MLANPTSIFLLASAEPSLLTAFEPILGADGARVEIFLSAEAALPALTAPHAPTLALLDANLPGMEMNQLLAATHAKASDRGFPIVMISDAVTPEWSDRLAEGVIDDLIPGAIESSFLRLRIEAALRNHDRSNELKILCESAALNSQTDPLTGVYNRQAILSLLFRETDRMQRTKSTLCTILFDIDDFGHWNERLGLEACDNLLCQVATRTAHLLRSYDQLGRIGKDEFIVALPGCSDVNAILLAKRIRADVFSTPFRVDHEIIRLSACFGIAFSLGRSPVVVLREAEQALQLAKDAGPESIQYADDCARPLAAPVAFLSPTSGDKLLAW